MKTHLLCLPGQFYFPFSPPSQMSDPDTPPQMTEVKLWENIFSLRIISVSLSVGKITLF